MTMTGSLQTKRTKAGKEYYYIVLTFYDNRKKWISTGLETKGNKKRAEQMLAEEMFRAKTELALEPLKAPLTTPAIPTANITFADAIREWLEAVAIKVDEVTRQGYELVAKAHILPYFDNVGVLLPDVSRSVIQDYINQKYQNGRCDGKGGLSPKSLRALKNIIYQTLKEAVIDNIIQSNPCEYISMPRLQRYEANYYTTDEVNTLLGCVIDEPLYPLIMVTVVYGLRRSEVLGLKWDSIDFTNELLTIKHTVCKVSTVVEKDSVKTKSSYRSFPLIPEVKTLLLELKEQGQARQQKQGINCIEDSYVFQWEDGHNLFPDYVSHKFSRLLEKNGLRHIRFHELRHSCASNLLAMGFGMKDIQEWLGHSDMSTTAKHIATLM
jgi:integrase